MKFIVLFIISVIASPCKQVRPTGKESVSAGVSSYMYVSGFEKLLQKRLLVRCALLRNNTGIFSNN